MAPSTRADTASETAISADPHTPSTDFAETNSDKQLIRQWLSAESGQTSTLIGPMDLNKIDISNSIGWYTVPLKIVGTRQWLAEAKPYAWRYWLFKGNTIIGSVELNLDRTKVRAIHQSSFDSEAFTTKKEAEASHNKNGFQWPTDKKYPAVHHFQIYDGPVA